MLHILIQNGVVIDGTGKGAFRADVGIAAGRIGLVAEGIEQDSIAVTDTTLPRRSLLLRIMEVQDR